MAITGTWKDRHAIQAGARKWGTGINPVHAVHTGDRGRDIAPAAVVGTVPEELQQTYALEPEEPWLYATDTPAKVGTPDHPDWGSDTLNTRGDSGNWPEWGNYENGIPGGSRIRSEIHGAGDQQTPNQVPTETVSEGWLNKVHSTVSDSKVSNPEQVFMQTSMLQRDRTRQGSQRGNGSASEYAAPIRSRIPGKKLKVWSGGRRHYDMQPREQVPRIRAWWNRSAGTPNPVDMEPNAMYESVPLTRQPPPDPNTGKTVGSTEYGYVPEDLIAFT